MEAINGGERGIYSQRVAEVVVPKVPSAAICFFNFNKRLLTDVLSENKNITIDRHLNSLNLNFKAFQMFALMALSTMNLCLSRNSLSYLVWEGSHGWEETSPSSCPGGEVGPCNMKWSCDNPVDMNSPSPGQPHRPPPPPQRSLSQGRQEGWRPSWLADDDSYLLALGEEC